MAPKRLLTIGEAAERLGIHQNTLRGWADRGRIPVIKLASGYRRFDAEVIETERRRMGISPLDAEQEQREMTVANEQLIRDFESEHPGYKLHPFVRLESSAGGIAPFYSYVTERPDGVLPEVTIDAYGSTPKSVIWAISKTITGRSDADYRAIQSFKDMHPGWDVRRPEPWFEANQNMKPTGKLLVVVEKSNDRGDIEKQRYSVARSVEEALSKIASEIENDVTDGNRHPDESE